MQTMLVRACVLVVLVAGVAVRQTTADPHYRKVFKDDDCSTTILYTTTKGETTKTVHQARYVITSTETVTETKHGGHHYGHIHTKTVTEDCDDHTHTKYVLKPVTVTESITKFEDETETVTHLKETTETVTKTHCGYGGYRNY